MTNTLTDEEKNFTTVALSKTQAIQSLLEPVMAKSLLISKAHVHLREASVLLALAVYKKADESVDSLNLFKDS